jgi:hypothetical protein
MSKTWYARNRERKIAYERARREADPEASRARARDYHARHREACNAKHRAWHAAHRESVSERSRQWREANAERYAELQRVNRIVNRTARFQGAMARRRSYAPGHTTAEWEAKKAAYEYRCAYCHETPERLTKDHVIPVRDHPDRNAVDRIDNIVPACLPCNLRKGTKRWS